MWKGRRSIIEMAVYGTAFAVAMSIIRRMPIDFGYKAFLGGIVGGMLGFLRDPAWEYLSAKFKKKK